MMRGVKRGRGSPLSSIAYLVNMVVEWCLKRWHERIEK